jgi:hypothetical protein
VIAETSRLSKTQSFVPQYCAFATVGSAAKNPPTITADAKKVKSRRDRQGWETALMIGIRGSLLRNATAMVERLRKRVHETT